MPFRVAKDYDNFLARLAAYPKQIDQIVEIMKRSIASRWMLPAVPLRSVPAQIEAQLLDDPTKSPLYQPFEKLPNDITESERSRLTTKARQAIMEGVGNAVSSAETEALDSLGEDSEGTPSTETT